jgi:site-specific recombinase XerD
MFIDTEGGWLFVSKYRNQITGRAIEDIFSKRLKLAGLSHKPYTPHTLRHNFATDMLNAGVDVCTIKELLGHTHIQSTTFYLHLMEFEEGLESPLDRLAKKKKGGAKNA